MANELLFTYPQSPAQTNFYGMLEQGANIVSASGVLVARSNWAGNGIDLSDSAAAGHYLGSVPANTPAGRYDFNVYQKAGAAQALTDLLVGTQADAFYWNGTREVSLTDLLGGILTLPTSVSLSTPSTTASSVGGVVKPLKVFQNTQAAFSWKIVDGQGNPVDLTTHTVKFFLHDTDMDVVEGTTIAAVLSASNPAAPAILDTITITVPPTAVPNAGRFQYKVRDYTSNAVYGSGPFVIDWCPSP